MVQSVLPPILPQEPIIGFEDPFLPLLQFPTVLQEKMPPELFAIVESEARAIHDEVIIPLLQAENSEKLSELFLSASPEYARHALLISLLVWSALRESLMGWVPEACRATQATFEERGPLRIGRQATDESLVGLYAFTLVTRGMARALTSPAVSLQPEGLDELYRWVIAFNVAFLPVAAYLLNGEIANDHTVDNVQVLANWSRYYGVGTYRAAKEAGLLSIPSQTGEDPYTPIEMLQVLDAGVADLSHLLD